MNARRQIFASDVQRLGGTVSIITGRDHTSASFYLVDHISRGGDVVWRSRPIADEDRAREAAQVLAQFTGSVVRL